MKIFLDSGAFSVWSRNESIDLKSYTTFCKNYKDHFDVIASLDVIPGKPNKRFTENDAKLCSLKGLENYEYMLKKGIPKEKLINTFHQGDPLNFLETLVKEGAYIGISPANDKTTFQRIEWLDTCMLYLLDSIGSPLVKFHGFAVTSLKLVLKYPWYSVDSSSWRLRGGGFGLLDIPKKVPNPKTKKDHNIISIPISKGIKNYAKEEENTLFNIPPIGQLESTFLGKPNWKENVELYLNKFEFSLSNLSEDYILRSCWNALYLLETSSKFTPINIYLASSDFASVEALFKIFVERKLDVSKINILVSYLTITGKNSTKLSDKSILYKLLKLKEKYADQ